MKNRQAITQDERPAITIGARVIVEQPGLLPWEGEAIAIKPGSEAWMVEVRNDEASVWSLPAHRVREVNPDAA